MDQFERLKLLINNNNFKNIQSKNVLVIGLGGVGSYAVEALIRSGISNITIVDNDNNSNIFQNEINLSRIDPSELNRANSDSTSKLDSIDGTRDDSQKYFLPKDFDS